MLSEASGGSGAACLHKETLCTEILADPKQILYGNDVCPGHVGTPLQRIHLGPGSIYLLLCPILIKGTFTHHAMIERPISRFCNSQTDMQSLLSMKDMHGDKVQQQSCDGG